MPLPINLDSLLHGKAVEWERLELKEGWNPLAVLHAICGFANDFHNLGGGYIIVGVEEEDGRPVLPPKGLAPGRFDAIQKEILELGNSAIRPSYHPVVVPHEVDGKAILVIWVPGGQSRPYKARVALGKPGSGDWAYFIRKGSSTVRAKGQEETELLSLAATVPFDDRLNQQARVEDLSRDLMREFLAEVGSDLALLAGSLPRVELGRQMNVVGGATEAPFPLNVGLLFFNPEPHRFFPATQIDVAWFPDGPGGDRFTEKIFRGPLHRMVREALDYVRRNYISETVIKHPDRAEATRVVNFPYAAVEEAVVNAIYHRCYEEREPVEVRVTAHELTVLSFPGPDRSIRLDQLRAGRAVSRRYRNRRIGEFLKELDLTEGRATGIPKILRAMAENGSPAPEFETDEDRISFLVRLPVHPEAARWAPGTEGEEESRPESEEARLESRPESKPLRPESEPSRPESRPESEGARPESRLESGGSRLESEPEWRSRSEWRAAWKPESVHDRVMAAISHEPLSRSKIAQALGHTSPSGAFKRALADLMQSGLIEITIPDKPNSRLQRYRLTGAGPVKGSEG